MDNEQRCGTCGRQLIRQLKERSPSPFIVSQLPEPIYGDTINLYRERVEQFRNEFAVLMEWAAWMTGVKPEELSPLHLIAPMLKEMYAEKDGKDCPTWHAK